MKSGKSSRKGPRILPALLRAANAAAFLDVSVSQLHRLHAAGEMPAPRKLGGCRAWSRRELLRWIDAGCPDRVEWEAREKRRTKPME